MYENWLSETVFNSGDSDETNVNEIVEYAKKGDSLAFAILSERYHRAIIGIVNSLNIPSSETEDMMQEGLIGLLKATRTFDSSLGVQFSTFAYTCIKNSILSALKRYNRLKKTSLHSSMSVGLEEIEEEYLSSPEAKLIDSESAQELQKRIISALSSYESKVFEMYLAEVPYAVMSKRLNKDVKSIDNALQRIKNKLKEFV